MSIESQEFEQKEINLITYRYRTEDEALRVFDGISIQKKEEMANVYQQAFGGYPWYERSICPNCQLFSKENICANCGTDNLPEAYPRDQLISSDFPYMLKSFTPGLLLLAYQDKQIVGFCTGGFVTLEKLVTQKYNSNQEILQSIVKKCAIPPSAQVFYDNETCLLPDLQNAGIGKQFSQSRISIAREYGSEYICGRTINLPWLQLKERQLNLAGYDFQAFSPNGETYSVEGVRRTFYLASKNQNK